MRSLAALAVLALAASVSATSIAVSVAQSGSYDVLVDGVAWLKR